MTLFDREMQRALMADAQKLRDEGVDVDDPIFLDEPTCFFCDAPCDESEVCDACMPKACAVLGRVVDSCLDAMRARTAEG